MELPGPVIFYILLPLIFIFIRWWKGQPPPAALPGEGGDWDLDVESIHFDDTGWQRQEPSDQDTAHQRVTWQNGFGEPLQLGVAEPFRFPLSDDDAVIKYGRDLYASLGGGLVSSRTVASEVGPGIEVVSKKEAGTGYLYRGALTLDLGGAACVFMTVHGEHGTTGTREALVTGLLLEDGEMRLDDGTRKLEDGILKMPAGGGKIVGWFSDPYDDAYTGTVLRSVTDDTKYDAMLPHHPLTRLRQTLETIRATIVIDDDDDDKGDAGPASARVRGSQSVSTPVVAVPPGSDAVVRSLTSEVAVLAELGQGVVIRCGFAGTYAPGSEGNPTSREMTAFVASAVKDHDPAAVVFDLSGLDYVWGDAICQIVMPLIKQGGSFTPSAVVARGGTAEALHPLFGPNCLLGVAGSRLYSSCDEALAQLEETLTAD